MSRITIQVTSRDRWSELGLLIESLRKQTVQDWDIIVLDDASGNPITNCHFLMTLFNQLKLEDHGVRLHRNEKSFGVCYARNLLLGLDDFNNPYVCRLDDDVVLDEDYLESLIEVIKEGYDVASGITPNAGMPLYERQTIHLNGIVNKISFDGDKCIVGDDCGYSWNTYDEDLPIYPAHHFRSCALFKKEVTDKIKYEPNLSSVGFREETFYSIRCLLAGFKIGVNLNARNIHLRTPSGGVRHNEYSQLVGLDEETFQRFALQNKDKLLEVLR